MMPSPQAGPPMGGSPAGPGGGQGRPDPEEVRQMLLQIIGEARKVAQENGIDFESLIRQGSSPSEAVPLPPRPSPLS